MLRVPARFALFALVAAGSIPSGAQTVSVVARDTAVVAAPATIVTTALRITNGTASGVALVPRIAVPAEWSVPMGTQPFALTAGETDTWIISIRVPARAPAGRYMVAVSAADSAGRVAARDSIAVVVSAVHGLELSLTNRPTYSVSGEMYRVTFILQNRGNGLASVTLGGTSSLGGRVALDSTRVTMAAGETRPVTLRVSTQMKGLKANDDVVELTATDSADTSVTASSSARVTIVQEANTAEPLHKVASTLRLRAAQSSAGVSPFELIGAGSLRDGGTERLSYVLRGSPGRQSQFGDQAEYRVELSGEGFHARVGDGIYKASELTSGGQMGAGVGVDVARGIFTAGAFAQSYRRQFDAPTEQGAYASATRADLFGAPKLSMSAVSRTGRYAGQIVDSKIEMTPFAGTSVEVEVAASTGPLGSGGATTARVSGGEKLHYDLGHVAANDGFSGITRGTSHDYASVSVEAMHDLRVSATLASHGSSGVSFGLVAPQSFNVGTVMLEYASRATLQYSSATRKSSFGELHYGEAQRGLLARTEETFGKVRMWGAAGAGVATTGADSHGYHELTLGGATSYGDNTISMYGETSDGMSLTRGGNHLMTVGGDVRVKVGPMTHLSVTGFQSSVLNTGERYSQLDGGISQQLSTGSTVSLRVRLAGNSREAGNHQLAFIEYAMPLQMPVGRIRSAGRVRGRVVDQETGRGVAGTLVRLGPQAAITDAQGNVAFAGLPAGEYRLTLAQQAAQTPSVFTGSSTVVVDSSHRSPTTFSAAIERAGTVTGSVRQMLIARTGLESVPDSLADAGPLNGISLALIGARDTLYVTTDAAGTFSFPEVASGTWVLRVTSDAPFGARWEPAESAVVVQPAVTNKVVFRSTPRRREVKMTSGEIIQAKQK
jgi:hypothetical protein